MTAYEGEPIKDGNYKLGQLSMPGYGRVVKDADELYNDMPVIMDAETFGYLFQYVKGRSGSITDFTAVVKNNEITHVY